MILVSLFQNNYCFTAIFTKPPDARTVSEKHSGCWSPLTAYGHFSVPLDWYQSKAESHEASGLVNSAPNYEANMYKY